MRKRGAIVILVAMPAWIYVVRFFIEVRRTPFGFGGVSYPASRESCRDASFAADANWNLPLCV